MPKMEKCRVCGSPVKPENLKRHLKKVHPEEETDIARPKKERSKRATRRGAGREKAIFVFIAIIVAAIILLAFIYEGEPPDRDVHPFVITDVTTGLIKRYPEDFFNEIVLLEFFSPHCGNCKDYIPTLNELYDNYSRDVNFISIDVNPDDTVQAVMDFIQEQSSREWTYAIDTSGEISKLYNVGGLPTTYILDLTETIEGEVAYYHSRPANYATIASELDQLLGP